MKNTTLIITSIASDKHPVLSRFAQEAALHSVRFMVIGDKKSPTFHLDGCDFFSIERQCVMPYTLAQLLPFGHYARKNLGYLEAARHGAEIIIETDDDNYPETCFWRERNKMVTAHCLKEKGWVNMYGYYTRSIVWPRGFALEHIQSELPELEPLQKILAPIQQGLADLNPDVDAIYRLTQPLPVCFQKEPKRIALGHGSICPFNSQNTTWFREAFPLMYLPSYCSFRMTDIWRSFVAQRIAWTCGWNILFHEATVWQERNEHAIIKDFKDEISGYCNNREIMDRLMQLDLKEGVEAIPENLIRCYRAFVEMSLIEEKELTLLDAWITDINS
ncbi:STELLO glycosyltransferase family protein [Tannerella forsythia]|uniref:STELLO glycosyltransferase family protein n=1 Tax=Tannerella forsythia TaxID=28112 RepID=UPI0028E29950|nr:STELLO glycosyltransferase family protein [Tannerella forsythia]